MKNVIELLAARLPQVAADMERELQVRYAVNDFQIQISSGGNKRFSYNVHCVDEVSGFQCAWSDDLPAAVDDLKKLLTLRSELKAQKLAKAKKLMDEANAT